MKSRIAISVVRPFHATLMANTLQPHASRLDLYTSAPRRFFPGLDPAVRTHLIPSPIHILSRLTTVSPAALAHALPLWDRLVATVMPRQDLTIGFATQALAVARKTRRQGSRFWLDRACPHVDAQQQIIREEAEATGAQFQPESAAFRERQLEEYALADQILVPSHYSADSFPPELRPKLVIAPILGRTHSQPQPIRARNQTFTLGVLGGNPLRKGLLYLLHAWKQLALPNARLLLRTSPNVARYPRIQELLRQPGIEVLPYIPDIATFYARCDAFLLPSVDDGFGMALFEAIAAGVPVVATTHVGAAELLTHTSDSLMVPPRSADALAEAIHTLYTDEPTRQSIAAKAQQTLARITADRVYEQALLARL